MGRSLPASPNEQEVSATWALEKADPSESRTLVSPGAAGAPEVSGREDLPLVIPPSAENPSTPPEEAATIDVPAPGPERRPQSELGLTLEHEGRYVPRGDEELGRGGIGRVFAAVDRHLEREVAVKELLATARDGSAAPPDGQAAARFLREARVTGQLEHPNIVPVYDLGRRADGTLYYTMRIVRGRTLAEAIADANDLGARLALVNHFSGLCQAMAYAHSRGVVHRDIKPQNVMIGEFGETIVLDWGTAKVRAISEDLLIGPPGPPGPPDPTLPHTPPLADATVEGSVCGTPIYMSPEQALGHTREVDERSDVWALGVVLYTILTGQPPFGGRTFAELRNKLESGTYASPSDVDRRIPPELAAIVARALRPRSSERYATAKEMAKDVQAYQAGGRVGAYEYSSLELLQRFLARQRAAVIASGVGLFAVMLLAVISYRRVVAARDRALWAERRAVDNEHAAEASARAARRNLGEMLVEKAELAETDGDMTHAEIFAAEALGLEERADARGVVLAAESTGRPVPIGRLPEAAGCDRYAIAANAGLVACARGAAIEVWTLQGRKIAWQTREASDVIALALAEGASALAVGDTNGFVRVYGPLDGHLSGRSSPADGSARALAEQRAPRLSSLAISRDGRVVAAGTSAGVVTAWTIGTSAEAHFQLGQVVSALAFAPNATDLAVGGRLGAVTLWNVRKGKETPLAGHAGTVNAFAFVGEGRILASGGADRALRFWDGQDARSLWAPVLLDDAVTSIAWSADARLVAAASKDKTFRLLDPRHPGRGLRIGDDDAVEQVALSDRFELLSVGRAEGARLWSLAPLDVPSQLVERGNVLSIAFDPKTRDLISAGLGRNGVSLWDVSSGTCSTRLPANAERVRAVTASPNGELLAFAGSGGQVFVWDLPRRIPTHVLSAHRDEVRALDFSSDGRRLASAGLDRSIRVFESSTGAETATLDADAPLQTLAFVPKTPLVLSGDRDGMLEIWNVEQKSRAARWKAHDDWVLAAAVSPDAKWFASAGGDRTVRLWNAASNALAFTLVGHESRVTSVSFSEDGALVASGSEDRSVRIWDVATGRQLAVLTGHEGTVRSVRFAPGRAKLASGGDDGSIRLWDLSDLRRAGSEILARTAEKFGVARAPARAAPVP